MGSHWLAMGLDAWRSAPEARGSAGAAPARSLARMRLLPIVLLFFLALASQARAEVRSLSQDWLFYKGDANGAEAASFNDGSWRKVAVPHDWSIMDKPDGTPPFDPKAEAGQDSGYLPGGTGWYRRQLTLTAEEAARVVRLKFEAVYMDADIWLNGERLAQHNYGYTAFTVD